LASTNSIFQNLTLIQLSRNPSIFEKANVLFIEKYKSETSFIAFYTKEWYKTDSKDTWFGGKSDVRYRNDTLESTNRPIKFKVTEYRAIPFANFLTIFNFVGENFIKNICN
jgi:hypothetical protein